MKKQIIKILLFILITNVAFSQNNKDIRHSKQKETNVKLYDSTNIWHFGIKGVQQINYPITHSIIAATFSKRNHNI